MSGFGVKIPDVRALNDPPGVHHRDLVGDAGNNPRSWVIRSFPMLRWLQILQQVHDLGLHRDIECGGGLVGDQHLGSRLIAIAIMTADACRRRTGVGSPSPILGCGDPHLLHEVDSFGHALLLGHAAVDLEHLRDLVADGEDRVQGRQRVLKIMAISAPRIFCRSDSGMVSRSLPL